MTFHDLKVGDNLYFIEEYKIVSRKIKGIEVSDYLVIFYLHDRKVFTEKHNLCKRKAITFVRSTMYADLQLAQSDLAEQRHMKAASIKNQIKQLQKELKKYE